MKARRKGAKLPLPDVCEVASATECTGLMPALPEDMAEDGSCAALYGIHRAEDPGKRE